MKQICCIDCEHCHYYMETYDAIAMIRYTCDAGTVVKAIEDPDKVIDCADFVQFIEDI